MWVYSGSGGGSYTATIEAPEWFAGWIVQPLQRESGVRENLSRDGSGRVFYHGSTYPDGGYIVFDPPILLLDSELALGHEWEAIADIIEYNSNGDEVFYLWERSTFRVLEACGVGGVPAETSSWGAITALYKN